MTDPTPPVFEGMVGAGADVHGVMGDSGVEYLLGCGDPVIAALVARIGPNGLSERREGGQREHYGALVRSIVGQQLSTKAAAAIYRRLIDRFDGQPPTPQQVLAEDPEQLRAAAGLSRAKVSFLRSLAEHVVDGSLELEKLDQLPDDEVIAELTAVKGIGEWSAHMFLMFHLEREDVLAVGDLGIRKAMMVLYGRQALPDRVWMTQTAQPWSPHRTLACRYLWRSLDNEPV